MKTSEDPRTVAARMERAFFVGTLTVCDLKLKVESRASFIKAEGRGQKAEVCCERLRYSSSLCGRPSLRILSSDLVVSPSHWQSGRKGTRTRPKITSAFCPLPSA